MAASGFHGPTDNSKFTLYASLVVWFVGLLVWVFFIQNAHDYDTAGLPAGGVLRCCPIDPDQR